MANNLTEQEILNDSILNSLLYMDELELSSGITLSEAVQNTEATNGGNWNIPMGVTDGKTEAIADYIKNDPELGNLKIVGYTCGEGMAEFQDDVNNGLDVDIKSGGPVIVALENEETKEVTFVFRGTNSLEWLDNAEGFMDESSKLQEQALEFFEKTVEENGYDKEPWKINVTGHSKGGNKAQYVTIKSKYEVNKCVSIDGQGFSNEFVNINQQSIDERSDKITTVCADMDYVNVLGHDISGDTIIYDTNQYIGDPKGSLNNILAGTELNYPMAHSCTSLFHLDNGTLTMNDQTSERKSGSKMLAQMSEYVMNNYSPSDQSKIFYSVMNVIQNWFLKDSEKTPILNNQQVVGNINTIEGIELMKEAFDTMNSRSEKAAFWGAMSDEAKDENHKVAAAFYKILEGNQKFLNKVDNVTNKAKKVFNAVTYPAQSAINTGKKLVQAAKNFGKNVVKDSLDFGKQQTEAVVDYSKDIVKDTVQLNQETTQAIVDSAGVGGALSAAKNVINKIKDKFSKTKENVKDTFDKVENFAKNTIDTAEELGDSAKDLAQDVAEDTVEYGKDVAEDTIEYGQNVGQAIAGNSYVQGAVGAGKDAVNNVIDKAGKAVDAVKDTAGQAVDNVKDKAGKAVDAVKDKAEKAEEFTKNTIDSVSDFTKDVAGDVKDFANDVTDDTVTYAQNVGQAVAGNTYVQAAVGTGKNIIDSAKDKIDIANDKITDVKDAVVDKTGQAVDAAKDTANDVKDAVVDKTGQVIDAAKDTANQTKDAINNFADKIKDAVSDKANEIKDTVTDAAKTVDDFVEDKTHYKETAEEIRQATDQYKEDVKQDTEEFKENVQNDAKDFKNDVQKDGKQNTQSATKHEKGERLSLKERIELSRQVRKEKEAEKNQTQNKGKSAEHDI